MRKFFVLTLAILMILALAACKSTTSEPETEPVETPEVSDSDFNTEETDPTESADITDTTETDETNTPAESDEPAELAFIDVNETVYIYGTNTLNVRKAPSADSEKMGEMKIIRTAGLDVVHLLNEHTFQECVENYYANL